MMKTNEEIETIVNAVLDKYVKKGGSYKFFDNIMKTEDIKFKEIDCKNKNFVGVLTKSNNDRLYIMVNNFIDNLGRKNFTIAHELGHYFLSHQLTQNHFYCSNDVILEEGVWQNSIEQEANYFASCFLMPEQKTRNAFLGILKNSRKAKTKDFLYVTNNFTFGIWCGLRDELTKRYGVSEIALRYRLKQLKLADFDFQA